MIIRLRIEIPVPDDRRHRPHLRRRLRRRRLIMIPQDNPNLRPLQSAHTMGGGQNVVLGEQRAATMEVAVVDDPRHPGVVVDAGGVAAHYAVLVVGTAALCREGC